MLLKDKLTKTGDFLFRWRSYLPLGLVILLFLERKHFYYFGSSHFYDTIFEVFCLLIAMFGFTIRVITVGYCRAGTSGRNIKGQFAASLNTDGIYSVVRNPLYLGNFFVVFGITMLSQNYELIIINVLLFSCFYAPIILREEEFLEETFKEEFLDYAKNTPAIVPNFKLWRRPSLKFNLIRILYREHDTYMGIAWGFYAVELLREFTINKRFCLDRFWTTFFVASLIVWAVLKAMKKYLKSLDKGQ